MARDNSAWDVLENEELKKESAERDDSPDFGEQEAMQADLLKEEECDEKYASFIGYLR